MISCIVNFKDNFTKNIPYYKLLLKQISDAQGDFTRREGFICEHTSLISSYEENMLSKICEGYQFIIAFDGNLENTDSLTKELSKLGYIFTSQSDAELALNAYIHFGEKAPSKLCGSFSFIIYDTMRRQIFAASDIVSGVPLFYTKSGDTYIFASQLRGIFSYPDIFPKISSGALFSLLSLSRDISEEIFEDIHMLPPCHILKIKDGEFVLKKYFPSLTPPVDCEHSEQEFLALMSEKLGDILTENSAVLHLGGIKDEFLSAISAKVQLDNMTRLTQYSTFGQGISKKYSALNKQIVYDENLLVASLKACVDICGLPVLSSSDFLLPMIFEKIPKNSGSVLTSLPDTQTQKAQNQKILLENKMFHKAVSETLKEVDEAKKGVRIHSANILKDVYGINLKSPFLSVEISDFLNRVNLEQDEFLYNATKILCGENMPVVPNQNNLLNLKLKRILLDIISNDSAPILAFFDKSVLLKLCERGLDLSGENIFETELLSYIIKLNLWFLRYRPIII